MVKVAHLASLVVLLFCVSALPAQTMSSAVANPIEASPIPPKQLHSLDVSFLDTTVDPCVDFYRYACGNWIKANPVPADQERVWITGQMDDQNFYLLYTELKQAAASPTTPLETQYGNFFSACMNADQANILGTKPILPTMAAIDAIENKLQIAGFLGDREYLGTGFVLLTVEQDERNAQQQIATLRQAGLTLPTPEYYLDKSNQQAVTLAAYHRYLITIFVLLGDRPKTAEAEAMNVLEVETALARGSMSRVEARDPNKTYHPTDLTTLRDLLPGFEIKRYFDELGAPPLQTVNVEQPDYVRTMARVIADQPLAALKSYLRIHAVDSVAPYLSAPFERASFEFFNSTLRGQTLEQPRWKRCTVLSDKSLGDAVGQAWIRRNFPPQSKVDTEEIIANVRAALRAEIEQLPWMSDSAKQEAVKKLDSMQEKIGYPSHWRDYSSLRISSTDFIADSHNAEVFNQQEALKQIGKPVDEGIFYWTVPEADGNYNEHLNDIEFPAGILQPPRYSPSADAAVNYGALGTLVGHEVTHGFDDVGSRYDEHGNLRDWFTPGDHKAFDEMNSCLVKEYSRFEVAPGLKLDGELSVGENTADNGGMRIAYAAFAKVLAQEQPTQAGGEIDGFTPDQRFFLGFGQSWCETRAEQYQRVRGKTDSHPPGEFRVNGTVQNFERFGKAFGCRVGQPMMPANACVIW